MKINFLITLIILTSVHTWAQTMGIRTGFNIAYQLADNLENFDPSAQPLPHIYFTINNEQAEKTSFQLEFGYSVTGSKEISLHYAACGIYVKQHFKRKANIHIGPQLGFLLDTKYSGIGHADASIGMGGEYYFSSYLGIGLRYQFGLTDLIDDFDGVSATLKNRVVQLSIIFRFPSRQLSELAY